MGWFFGDLDCYDSGSSHPSLVKRFTDLPLDCVVEEVGDMVYAVSGNTMSIINMEREVKIDLDFSGEMPALPTKLWETFSSREQKNLLKKLSLDTLSFGDYADNVQGIKKAIRAGVCLRIVYDSVWCVYYIKPI